MHNVGFAAICDGIFFWWMSAVLDTLFGDNLQEQHITIQSTSSSEGKLLYYTVSLKLKL